MKSSASLTSGTEEDMKALPTPIPSTAPMNNPESVAVLKDLRIESLNCFGVAPTDSR